MSTAAYSAKLEAFQAGLAKAKERDKRAIAKDKAARRKSEAALRKSAVPHCHRPVVEALVTAEIKGSTSFRAWSNARLARIRDRFKFAGHAGCAGSLPNGMGIPSLRTYAAK